MANRYEVRKNSGGKFDVFDLGTKSGQVTNVSERQARRLCEQANRKAPALKNPPPGLRNLVSPGPTTVRRLDERKAIER